MIPPSPTICVIPRISRAGILHQIFRFSGGVNIWNRIHQSKSWYSLGLSQTSLMLFVKGPILDVWLVLQQASKKHLLWYCIFKKKRKIYTRMLEFTFQEKMWSIKRGLGGQK